jgi:hypothetical protein
MMINWMKGTIARQLDQQAERRHRSALRAEGIPLEAALTLAKDARPRKATYRTSLGETGHRDWTQLRTTSHWASEADKEKLDDVLARLVGTTKITEAEYDIADVTNILLSKSRLTTFMTMDAFGRRTPNHEYGQGSPADLQRCLAHDQVRCLKGTMHRCDSFTSFGWDDRLLLNNNGGSHHFSAARRIAMELGVKVPLQLNQEHHVLNADTVHFLERTLALMVIPYPDLLDDLKYALRREQIPVIPGRFKPPVCYGHEALVLPLSLNSDLSVSAAGYLRSCGFTDLVDHLIEDLGVQEARSKRLN